MNSIDDCHFHHTSPEMSLILRIRKDACVFVSLIISLGLSVSEENIIEPTCTKLDNIIKVSLFQTLELVSLAKQLWESLGWLS